MKSFRGASADRILNGMMIRGKLAAIAATALTVGAISFATAATAGASPASPQNPGNSCSPGADVMPASGGDLCYYQKGEYWVQTNVYRVCSGDHYGWVDTMDRGFINFGAWQCFNVDDWVYTINLDS